MYGMIEISEMCAEKQCLTDDSSVQIRVLS